MPGLFDDHVSVLLDAGPDRQGEYSERLEEALTHFDRAQIFTIHGFALRLLEKLGFRSRLSGDMEPREIDELLLRRAASDLVVGRFAVPRANDRFEQVTQEHLAQIGKVVVTVPDARITPAPDSVDGLARVRAEMAREMKSVLSRRLWAEGTVTFDDTLVEARDALNEERVGAGARDLLRRRFSIALVDEAQDTDPIQWQILRAVFDQSRLVVIGDPKQVDLRLPGRRHRVLPLGCRGPRRPPHPGHQLAQRRPADRSARRAAGRSHLRGRPYRLPAGAGIRPEPDRPDPGRPRSPGDPPFLGRLPAAAPAVQTVLLREGGSGGSRLGRGLRGGPAPRRRGFPDG